MPISLRSIASWSVRHRWLVLGVWVLLLIGATLAHHAVGSVYSDNLTIPGSPAQTGLNALNAHSPKAGGEAGQLVFVDRDADLGSRNGAVEQAAHNVSKLPHVLSVSNPLTNATTSKDGHTAYATVNFDENPQSLGSSYVDSVDRAVAPARSAGIDVSYGGTLGAAAAPKASDASSELIGIAVALLVLLIGFGSVYAALLPLATSIVAVAAGVGALGTLAAAVVFSTSAPTLAIMMGLGVGIDYALFLTTRHRQLLLEGETPAEAIAETLAGSGRSVLIAASTVVIAMLGLYASGISFVGKLGLAAAITVAVSALAALTLVPAMLGFARARIDRLHLGRPVAEPVATGGALHRYTRAVARHPLVFATIGIALLLVLAIPALSMNLGHVGAGSEPKSYSERQAYDAVSDGFGAGANAPLTVVVKLGPATTSKQRAQLERRLPKRLNSVPDIQSVGSFAPSSDGALLVGKVIPKTGPSAAATETLDKRLQNQTLPRALAADGATGYVTGTTAATIDFQSTVSSRLPLIIGTVVLAALLLLLASFRSPVVALKAALLNLLSIGAACGVVVAVFQWGWGAAALGISGTVPIESYVPMIIFAIVFGLSMDYEVFLISRIREHWLAGESSEQSVAHGLAQTARVITCAALIMASVFFAFLLSTSVVVKMLALGLGVSVIIDATIVRLMIVPALMFKLGRIAWWAPSWLDRLLPRLEPELRPPPAPALASTEEPVAVGANG